MQRDIASKHLTNGLTSKILTSGVRSSLNLLTKEGKAEYMQVRNQNLERENLQALQQTIDLFNNDSNE